MALKFEHEKSHQIEQAVSIGEKFKEVSSIPSLMWLPVIALVLIALDWASQSMNADFAATFFNGDGSWPLIGGVILGCLFAGVAVLMWMRRRSALWLLVFALVLEFLFVYFLQCDGVWQTFLLGAHVPVVGTGPGTGTDPGIVDYNGAFFVMKSIGLLAVCFFFWFTLE